MNDCEYEDDEVVSFVFNSETQIKPLSAGCNPSKEKFFFPTNEFSFQKHATSLMLNRAYYYSIKELYSDNIKIFETIPDKRCREIKNCINKDSIEEFGWELIRSSFKTN